MEYPRMMTFKNVKYEFVKEYKHFALYQNKKGIRTCFKKFDCGIIKKYPIELGGKYGKMC